MISPRTWHRDYVATGRPLARASAVGAAPAGPQYFLEVSLKLGLDSVDEFFRLAKTVLTSVEKVTTLKLEAAGHSPTRTELLHIWSLPSPDALREGMVRLADNPAYGQLDALVVDERQEITTPFGRVVENRPRPGKGGMYLRVAGHVAARNLAEYQALQEVVPPTLPKSNWHLWTAFLNVTGRLNRVTSIWVIPRPGNITSPGMELLTDVEIERWSPTAYSP